MRDGRLYIKSVCACVCRVTSLVSSGAAAQLRSAVRVGYRVAGAARHRLAASASGLCGRPTPRPRRAITYRTVCMTRMIRRYTPFVTSVSYLRHTVTLTEPRALSSEHLRPDSVHTCTSCSKVSTHTCADTIYRRYSSYTACSLYSRSKIGCYVIDHSA